MLVSRSFDVNKPGDKPEDLKGGVLGGILKQGQLKEGDNVVILPGLKIEESGQTRWEPLKTKIDKIFYGNKEVKQAVPGGNFGLSTLLDFSLTRGDALAGSVICSDKHLVQVHIETMNLKPKLMERVVGTSKELQTGALRMNEPLMINAFTAKTIGIITKVSPKSVTVKLKLPVAIDKGDSVAISRFINNKWRLVGSAEVI